MVKVNVFIIQVEVCEVIFLLLHWGVSSSALQWYRVRAPMDPRNEIERADYISRIIHIDDWQISADCFLSLEESRGGSFSGLF